MTGTTDSTSSGLIQRVKDNDQTAWHRLATVYSPLVYKWARNVGLQPADAADIGQEVFRTVAIRISSFQHQRPGPGFRAWLRQITRNKIGDYLRQRQNTDITMGGTEALIEQLTTLPEVVDETTDALDRMDLLNAVFDLIKTEFREPTWQAFWRAAIEEQPFQQIAEDLQMSTKAVRQAKYRVLKRVRDEFGDLLD